VTLVVWHKMDIREVSLGSLVGTLFGLAGVTAATLYQRHFSPRADLKTAALVQFAVAAAAFVPLAIAVEGFEVTFSTQLLVSIAFLVLFASILGVSVLNYLMRRGQAFRVASMMYLPPIFAVALELAMFGLLPGPLALAGMAIACAGVAMTVWTPRWRSFTS
jgi:drug/metabolite transporter (DMT)-like permease